MKGKKTMILGKELNAHIDRIVTETKHLSSRIACLNEATESDIEAFLTVLSDRMRSQLNDAEFRIVTNLVALKAQDKDLLKEPSKEALTDKDSKKKIK